MVVAMTPGREKRDRNAIARVFIVVAAAVVLLRMTVRIVRVIDAHRRGFRLGGRVDDFAELRRKTFGADQLHIAWATILLVVPRAAADHVHVQLRDDRVTRDRGMIREIGRAPQTFLLAGVPDEDDRALRLHRTGRERLRDLEHRHAARAVVVRAVEDRIRTRWVDLAEAVDDLTDLLHLRLGRWTTGIVGALRTHDRVERAQRIVIDGHVVEPDVIVVRADRNVLSLQLRIAARQNGDDVASRSRHVFPLETSLKLAASGTARQTRDRSAEEPL